MDSINLTEVPGILSYGAIGLAFLMMLLSFLLLRGVISVPNPSRGTQTTCRLFLLVALLSLVAGCLLEIYGGRRPININLVLTPQMISGVTPPKIVLEARDVQLQDGMGRLRVVDGSSIVLQLDSLITKIRELQLTLGQQAGQQAKLSNEMGPSNEF